MKPKNTKPEESKSKATKSKQTKIAEFLAYSAIALFLLAIAVGGLIAHLALIRWGLRLWPI